MHCTSPGQLGTSRSSRRSSGDTDDTGTYKNDSSVSNNDNFDNDNNNQIRFPAHDELGTCSTSLVTRRKQPLHQSQLSQN